MVKAKTTKLRDKKGRFKKGRPKTGGRKKESKNKKTIEREKALETYHQTMLQGLMPLVRAQQSSAKGIVVVLRPGLVKNPKTKKLERTGELRQVKDPDEIERLFNLEEDEKVGENYHIVFAKDPNVKALQDIFDRVFGKAKEEIDLNIRGKELKKIQDGVRSLIEMAKKRNKN